MNLTRVCFSLMLLLSGFSANAPFCRASENAPLAGELAAPAYPDSVKERFESAASDERGRALFYTKDPIDKVKAFYEKTLGASLPIADNTGSYCKNASSGSGCVRIMAAPGNSHAFSLMHDDLGQSRMGLPVNKDFHAACVKYEYLSKSFFPLSEDASGGAGHQETPDALYAKYVTPVEREARDEARQDNAARKQREQTADGQKEKEERKKKEAERKKVRERIKQLKAEGRNDEAMALAMQMAQDNQGEMQRGMAEASARQGQESKKDDKIKQAYVTFLQELAKQPAYATKIVIDSAQTRDYTSQQRDYTAQKRKESSGKSSTGVSDAIDRLKGLFGR